MSLLLIPGFHYVTCNSNSLIKQNVKICLSIFRRFKLVFNISENLSLQVAIRGVCVRVRVCIFVVRELEPSSLCIVRLCPVAELDSSPYLCYFKTEIGGTFLFQLE